MVDTYQTGEPIPDGYLHIQLIHPVNPWIDYLPNRDMPDDLEEDFNVRHYFRDTNGHAWDAHGIRIKYDDHIEFYPYSNIHNVTLRVNSQEYLDTLHDFQLRHDHEWVPRTDNEGTMNFRYCPGCKVKDIELDHLEQEKVDRERNLSRD